MSDEKKFVLLKRGLYWRPDGKGYTGLKAEAGLYSLDDAALTHCEYMLTPEVSDVTSYMLYKDAPEYAPSCCEWIKNDNEEKKRARFINLLNYIKEGLEVDAHTERGRNNLIAEIEEFMNDIH